MTRGPRGNKITAGNERGRKVEIRLLLWEMSGDDLRGSCLVCFQTIQYKYKRTFSVVRVTWTSLSGPLRNFTLELAHSSVQQSSTRKKAQGCRTKNIEAPW